MVFLTAVVPGLIFFGGVIADNTHGWEKIASGVALLACVILGIRTARLGIFASSEQLVVRDYFRTYWIRWQDIASIEMPPRFGTWRKDGLRIRLTDGRLVSATLYARGRLDFHHAPRAVVQELDRLRKQFIHDRIDELRSPTELGDDSPG